MLVLVTFISLFAAIFWITCLLSIYLNRTTHGTLPETSLPEIEEDLPEDKEDILLRKLTDYIEHEQAYLQPCLTLDLVCKTLGTNRTYLSSVINKHFGVNFSTFINQYRVKYMREYKRSYPLTKREELAQIAGFGSVSSMQRAKKQANE